MSKSIRWWCPECGYCNEDRIVPGHNLECGNCEESFHPDAILKLEDTEITEDTGEDD